MKVTQLVTTQANPLTTQNPPTMVGIVPGDIIIPRVLLMQGLSDFVQQRKAQIGDIVRSTTMEKLGDETTPFAFIPLAQPIALWVKGVKRPGEKKFKYCGVEPRTASNDHLPWNYTGDERGNENTKDVYECQRVKAVDVYALLPQDIEAEIAEMNKTDGFPDLSKALTPVMIRFKSTSFNAGKDVVTFFTQAANFKKEAWQYSILLGCYAEKNDEGQFHVYKVDRTKPQALKPEALEKAKYWAQVVGQGTKLKVDEEYTAEF